MQMRVNSQIITWQFPLFWTVSVQHAQIHQSDRNRIELTITLQKENKEQCKLLTILFDPLGVVLRRNMLFSKQLLVKCALLIFIPLSLWDNTEASRVSKCFEYVNCSAKCFLFLRIESYLNCGQSNPCGVTYTCVNFEIFLY